MKNVAVVGSLNMDVTLTVEQFPQPGETILSHKLSGSMGGKGANQAVSLARMGTAVSMVGMVGNDAEGNLMKNELSKNNINVDNILVSDTHSTGRAHITVNAEGNNSIIVYTGANFAVDQACVDKAKDVIKKCDAVLLQLEIPIPSVHYTLKLAKELGKLTVLNPAPSHKLDDSVLQLVDIIVPNQVELEQFTGIAPTDEKSLVAACESICKKGVKVVVVTLGKDGCYAYSNGKGEHYTGYDTKVVDTTAAGDSFIGGFLREYLESIDLEKAVLFGQKVAAIAISKQGAMQSIPFYDDVVKSDLKRI